MTARKTNTQSDQQKSTDYFGQTVPINRGQFHTYMICTYKKINWMTARKNYYSVRPTKSVDYYDQTVPIKLSPTNKKVLRTTGRRCSSVGAATYP